MLRQFHFIDQNGKDQGINVRNRAKELAELLSDVDRIRAERKKARANRNKFGGVEGGMGMGGFSGSGGFSGGGNSSRYGGFSSEDANAGYGGYSGGVYGDGGGFGGNESGFSDTQARRDRFEEYDEDDDAEMAAPPRKAQLPPSQVKREPKKEEPKAKAPEPVADLLAWDDELATPSVGKQPVAPATNDFGDDDDFDDFQSAAPVAKPAAAPFIAPPASTSTVSSSTQFAAPQPHSAAQNNNLNDLFATVSPPPGGNRLASPPITTPTSGTSNISQPYRPSGYEATGPNYFTSVPVASNGISLTGSSSSVKSPGMGGNKIGPAAPKKAGGDAFASLLAGSAPKKASAPPQKVTMADMAKQKTSQGLWGAPASGASTPAAQPHDGAKPGGALGDLLG